jgi:hypothetical protein
MIPKKAIIITNLVEESCEYDSFISDAENLFNDIDPERTEAAEIISGAIDQLETVRDSIDNRICQILKDTYVLVTWPNSQRLMNHERFKECLLIQDTDGHNQVGSSAYMCPSDLFDEIFEEKC